MLIKSILWSLLIFFSTELFSRHDLSESEGFFKDKTCEELLPVSKIISSTIIVQILTKALYVTVSIAFLYITSFIKLY
jgi:hypothetical protein